MYEEQPDSMRRLLTALDELADLTNPAVCRGQSDAAWKLQPSLDRNVNATMGYAQRLEEEQWLFRRFRDRCEHLLGPTEWEYFSAVAPTDFIAPMTIMQHFGAPTRLLDWSYSPFAAAFFAAVDTPNADGAVWWCREINRFLEPQWNRLKMRGPQDPHFDYNPFCFREDGAELIGPVCLKSPFPRAQAQQGLFTIAGRLGLFHDDLMSRFLDDKHFGKLVIRKQFKRALLSELRARGVTAVSLQHVGADRLGFELSKGRGNQT